MKSLRPIALGLTTFAGLIILRQECFAGDGSDIAESAPPQINWLEELQKGGFTGIALFLVASLALYFFVERLINLRRKNLIPDEATITEAMKLSEGDQFDQADALYQSKPSTFTKVVAHLAEYRDSNRAELFQSAGDLAARDIEHERRKAYGLGVASTIAPLLGLLGTMVGMIEAFAKFSKLEDSGEAAIVLGDSIGKALITTAVGLIIAIPTLGAHHWFKTRINRYSDELEAAVDRVCHRWFLKRSER